MLLIGFVLPDHASAAATQASKEEVDSRSIYVGNVSSLNLCFVCIFGRGNRVYVSIVFFNASGSLLYGHW